MTVFPIKNYSGQKGGQNTLIYDKVKELAKEKGVTIQQMEKDLSIAEGYACKWNTSQPKISTLMKIADYFGVPLDYFKDSDEKGD